MFCALSWLITKNICIYIYIYIYIYICIFLSEICILYFFTTVMLRAQHSVSVKFWDPTTSSKFLFSQAHHLVDTRCDTTHFMSQAVNTWNVHNFDVNTNTQVLSTVSCHAEYKQQLPSRLLGKFVFNPLNAELNPICHLLALLEPHHILHVSKMRVNDNARFSASSCEGAEGRMLVRI